MWKEFDQAVAELFRFVNGKRVVLWGWERSGWFIEHLFRRANRQIEYIVDDGPSISPKMRIYRSFLLADMDPDTHAVLLTFGDDGKAKKFLEEHGYREGKNFLFVRDVFYANDMRRQLSYHDWLEYRYGVDIVRMRALDEIVLPDADCLYYSAGIDYALMDVLDNFAFGPMDAVFDFGCGKGGALSLFQKAGVGRLGGVEYDPDLYRILCGNFQKFGCSTQGLMRGDAALCKEELDGYNYFFMYNPFQGKTFDRVVQNMQESFERKRRRMTFIYSGTYCHNSVLQNSSYKLSKTVYTDYSVRYVNVYTMDV